MAWIEERKRGSGGVSVRVVWRLGGTREGARQVETFSVGTNDQNLARATSFMRLVDLAGQRWPGQGRGSRPSGQRARPG